MRAEDFKIPNEWSLMRLGDIGESIIGLTYSPEDVVEAGGGGTLVLRSSNIQESRLCFDDNVYVKCRIPERLRTRKGDILVCVRNGSRDLIGKSALVGDDGDGKSFGAFMAVFRTESPGIVFQFFQTDWFRRQAHQNLGATINQITNSDLASFFILMPPRCEGERIATILNTWDEAIAKTEALVEATAKRRRWLIGQLLSGKKRFKSVSEKS